MRCDLLLRISRLLNLPALRAASVPSLGYIRLRSAARPRDRRERIVLIGTSKTVPASSYEMPSRPTRRITWRCSSEFERERDRDRAMTAALSDRLALYQIRSSYPPMFSTKCQPSTAPQREWGRRNLDYGEAQSFQDLLLCRSLRLVGDELHAGLAGSSWISVQDLQTHSPTLRRRHLLNMPASSDHG
jgi:hypothetical protein